MTTAPPILKAIDNLWQKETVQNPYPSYRQVRALSQQGMLYIEEFNTIFAVGHAACSAVLRSPVAFSGGAAGPPISHTAKLMQPMMLFHNGFSHQRLRGLMQAAFTPRVVEEQRELVRHLLDELLSAMPQTTPTDLVSGLAEALPARVIMHMLGLKGSDEEKFVRWSKSVAELLGGNQQSPELMAQIEQDAREMRSYFRDLADELRANPQVGLLSALAAVEDGGERLSGDELLSNAVLLLTAGHETTSNLIPSGLLELANQPEAWAALVANLSHNPSSHNPSSHNPSSYSNNSLGSNNVADELLRIVSPVQFDGRSLSQDLQVLDTMLAAGNYVQLMLGAANRDPEVFAEPDKLDWNRTNSARHLAFAAGPHYCLGASLARLEINETFALLAQRYPSLTVVQTQPPYKANPVLRGPKELQVILNGYPAT